MKYDLVPKKVPSFETPWRRIRTALPVPESVPILEKLLRHEPRAMFCQPPVIWDRAEGCQVFDPYGNVWLDWSSTVLVANIGHGHPNVCKALNELTRRPLLATYVFAHELRAKLVEKLSKLAPPPLEKVFLLSTGSEAVENAIKLAFTWGRNRGKDFLVSFHNGFHGRTLGAQLAGGLEHLKNWIPFKVPNFVQVPFPDGYKNPDTRFELFEETLQKQGVEPKRVCAVLSETYQGVGPDFMPVDYARKLRRWCDENEALLIFDEVQAGFGRTGKLFGFEHYGIVPDLVCFGKGITSSLPLSAVMGRAEIMDQYPPGSMTSTHSASPLPVASALASIETLLEEKLIDHASRMEPVLKEGLERIQALLPDFLGCLRVKGMVAGVQVVKPGTKEPYPELALAIQKSCFYKGLLLFAPVGVRGECLKICPPLCTPEDALREGLEVFEEACRESCEAVGAA